ncbi:tumor necrosis factor ligand superfamily member 15-like [Latimeria chalumnae]|uniref:tumor necrosis factor ligand superfamily member 15-like n=1 Tax=Latimeria chalumnae TaxID=7897 RepID=UPI00313C0E3F
MAAPVGRVHCSGNWVSPSFSSSSGSGERKEKPAAHLTGKGGHHGDHMDPLQWDYNRGMAFLSQDFAFHEGGLVVPALGLYYVYAQAVFHIPQCADPSSPNPFLITYTVYKTTESNPKEIVLLTATKSVCGKSQTSCYTTISQGALFALKERDRLLVNTSHPSLMENNQQKTFFGTFMV